MSKQPSERPLSPLHQSLETALLEHGSQGDASHDVYHARRVLLNACAIANHSAPSNERVVSAACYLHDLVNVPKNSPDRHLASRLSAQAAKPILISLNYNDDEINAIQHCIEAHSFSAAITPKTLEACIVQDADRLESVGALGIARTFFTAGKMDSHLFNAADPFAQSRPLDDIQYSVDHFKKKLLTLADTMQTKEGRRIAIERTQMMREFLNSLAEELGVTQPW